MTTRRMASMFAILAVSIVAVTLVWGQVSPQEVRKESLAIHPYQVLSGQVAATTYEVVFVLDNESRRLAVLNYNWTKKQMLPVAGRDLAKDFNNENSGGYTMVSTQLADQAGLLYVTDHGSRMAIVYQVDLSNNTITPQQPPVDLKKLFGD